MIVTCRNYVKTVVLQLHIRAQKDVTERVEKLTNFQKLFDRFTKFWQTGNGRSHEPFMAVIYRPYNVTFGVHLSHNILLEQYSNRLFVS